MDGNGVVPRYVRDVLAVRRMFAAGGIESRDGPSCTTLLGPSPLEACVTVLRSARGQREFRVEHQAALARHNTHPT